MLFVLSDTKNISISISMTLEKKANFRFSPFWIYEANFCFVSQFEMQEKEATGSEKKSLFEAQLKKKTFLFPAEVKWKMEIFFFDLSTFSSYVRKMFSSSEVQNVF